MCFRTLWIKCSFLKRQERRIEVKERKVSGYGTAVLASILRIFRSVLIYLNHRLNKIKGSIWRFGGSIEKDHQTFFTENEIEFYIEYRMSIFAYGASFPANIDLFVDLTPPRSLTIEVRVLEECGEIMTEEGEIINLEKGSCQTVRKSQVENLLLQNKLMQIK